MPLVFFMDVATEVNTGSFEVDVTRQPNYNYNMT